MPKRKAPAAAAVEVKPEPDVKPELEVRATASVRSIGCCPSQPDPIDRFLDLDAHPLSYASTLTLATSRARVPPAAAQDAHEAPPTGSEQVESALRDFLASKKQSMTHLPRLLSLLDPLNLRAGAIKGKYNTAPKWSDENTTPQQLRAHWRAQCAAITKTKEDALPDALSDALRRFHWPASLDTARAESLSWLVKVPAFVTRAWRATAEALANADEIDDVDAMDAEGGAEGKDGGGDDGDALGEMKIAVDPFAPPEKRQRHFLTLSNRVSETHRVPAAYDMLINPEEQPIHVFSGAREDTAAAAAAAAAATARACAVAAASGIPGPVVELPRDDFILEGTVSEKFDVRPADVDDSLYREVSARRIAEATRKTRVVQASKGPSRVAPLPTARNIVKREDGKEDTRERAERMERGALEDKLMGLYERRSLWSFKQLKEETRQPAMFLKETLDGLATLNRRGPNVGMYSLKDMYKRRGAGGVGEGGGGAGGTS
ncbi:uncharacterized protein MICPUCDRAFT_53479 [Micromonas pusilla CCMP1545]|uniref:Predicted protein n=1 Tax=Micromonas pusilla (strain CCMP1545) TaxID=564608 RepID=C1N6X8_MICPC|nr:uncharacterized protein MICPUCDRAFT_53479 [Micromonas pusilla CCMP1545]EEH52004.1 predicted protein [Micromonas pusilla CCMP1545]|eukprot:XP_003063631.1 predicted protein [Micromonas pusilla CCMP1545]